ncbi:MAG: GGDEF domain-containing protein [Dehalococcoidia bacterium]
MPKETPNEPTQSPANVRRTAIRAVSLAAWAGVICWQVYATLSNPTLVEVVTTAGFTLLFLAVLAQMFLFRRLGDRKLHRAMTRLQGSAYLSDLDNLPNRNYLLSELRREMPRARTTETPFVLIILTMETFADVSERRGEAFGQRSLMALAQVLKRYTRTSDFIAHLGGPQFCVMLNECLYENAFIYLQRVPGTIAVSDGHRMLEVPVTARVHVYDMENLYATDVLRDAEECKPLRRAEQPVFGSEAA